MTIAATVVAAPAAPIVGRGASALAGRVASGGRGTVRNGRAAFAKDNDARAHLIEQVGDGMGRAGVPFGGDLGKVAAYFPRGEVRTAWSVQASRVRTQLQEAAARIEYRVRHDATVIRAAAEMSRGVPDEVVEHMRRAANVP